MGDDGSIHIDAKIDQTSIKPQLASMKSNIASAFASIRDVMQGPVQAGRTVIETFKKISAVVDGWENEWAQSEQAVAILGSTLKATGASSWTSSKQIQDFANELQDMTGYADDNILAMENVLLGFKNIKGDNFKEASVQILNMAKVMGMDLTSAAQAVGKALDDPINGVDSLSRQGFKFSDSQKAVLKELVKTGQQAKAQKIILDELATTYGGAAESANQTGTAIKQKLNLAVQDMNKELGRSVSNNLAPFRQAFLNLAKAIGASMKAQNDFVDNMKKINAGTATTQEAIDGLTEEYNRLKQSQAQFIASGDTGPADVMQLQIDETLALLNAKKLAQNYEAKTAAAKKANDEAAAKQAEIDQKNAEQQVLITAARLKAVTEYQSAVKKADMQAADGSISAQEAEEKKLDALKTEIGALEDIAVQYKLSSGATVALIDSETQKRNALAASIGMETQAILDSNAAKIQERNAAALAIKQYNDEERARDGASKSLSDLTLSLRAQAQGVEDDPLKAQVDSLANLAEAAGVSKDQIDALYEAFYKFKENAADTSTIDSFSDHLKTSMGTAADTINSVYDMMAQDLGTALNAIGESLVTGESDWSNWGISALKALASVLNSIGYQLVAYAALHTVMLDFVGAAVAAAAAAAAFVAAGVISGYAGQLNTAAAAAEEAAVETEKYVTALSDANKGLATNKKLFQLASKAGDAYDSVLTGIVKSASSFYESLQDIGSNLASTIIDSITSGFDNDDFLYALEEYIRNAVIRAAVFTDSFASSLASIGTQLAQAIASGNMSSIESLKNQLTALYATASATAEAATSAVSGAFGSYAVGSLGLPSDGLIYAHQGEAVIPAGLMSEALTKGLTIAPTASLMAGAGNVTVNLSAALNVDGKAMAGVVFKYQDDLIGAAYGA